MLIKHLLFSLTLFLSSAHAAVIPNAELVSGAQSQFAGAQAYAQLLACFSARFENVPAWRRPLHHQYDKTAFYFHNLGAFVTTQDTLAYALALGLNMNYRVSAAQLNQDGAREWLKWLDKLQKTVGPAQQGQPLKEFIHTPDTLNSSTTGAVYARYGSSEIRVNLGPETRKVKGLKLPSFGFLANFSTSQSRGTQGTVAGILSQYGDGFIFQHSMTKTNGGDLWIYAPPETEVPIAVIPDLLTRIRLPQDQYEVIFDGQAAQRSRQYKVRTPARPDQNRVAPFDEDDATKYLWHAVLN